MTRSASERSGVERASSSQGHPEAGRMVGAVVAGALFAAAGARVLGLTLGRLPPGPETAPAAAGSLRDFLNVGRGSPPPGCPTCPPARFATLPLRDSLRLGLCELLVDPAPSVRAEAARALWKAPRAFGPVPAAAESLAAVLDRARGGPTAEVPERLV